MNQTPKFRWLHLTEDYELRGTNNEKFAKYLAKEHGPVADVIAGAMIDPVTGLKPIPISELEEWPYIDGKTGEYWLSEE